MNKRPVIIGSGQYNYDIIKVRDYPDGFTTGKRNPYTETILTEEVGGTCGNVMCMLAHLGWDARPSPLRVPPNTVRKLLSGAAGFITHIPE